MNPGSYPRVRVKGGPIERGRQYGSLAREQVHRSLEAYSEVFVHYAGWRWTKVTGEAKRYEPAIARYDGRYLEEMQGIAEGAGVELEDVLALNVRTEVMFAAMARDAAEQSRMPSECSSFAILPSASAEGRMLIGQNWDWLPHSFDTVVILEVEPAEGPGFITVVEGGLLAKAGMNEHGIGVVTNALVTAADKGEPAVPYHVILRGILDSASAPDALGAIQRRPRSSSANYLLAHRDGLALDVEAAPGDFSALSFVYPDDGVLLHTNHFLVEWPGREVSAWAMPSSPFRLGRLRELVGQPGKRDVASMQEILADHAGHPHGLCCHPDDRLAVHDQTATVTSLIMDLGLGTMWVTGGSPCSNAFLEVDWGHGHRPA